MSRPAKADVDRFKAMIAGPRGRKPCWIWVGATDKDGYGLFSLGGKTLRAHRVSFWIAHGHEPRGKVLHGCGNHGCVNPHHLDDGTSKENVEDMRLHGTLAVGNRNGARKHPGRLARGSRVGTAKLTERDVKRIIRRALDGESYESIGASYGVNRSTISRIINGQQWRHV